LPEHTGLQLAPLGPEAADGPAVVAEEVERFRARMDDDLDTPGALAGLFDAASRANGLADAGDEAAAVALASTVATLCGVLGLALHAGGAIELDAETQRLVTERDAARAASDYARADAIRDQLVALGWGVEDGPTGTQLRR
jgi:cysteinyl-tRNA synthetase